MPRHSRQVRARLKKLARADSAAARRLFGDDDRDDEAAGGAADGGAREGAAAAPLRPAHDIIRRLLYDATLDASHFYFGCGRRRWWWSCVCEPIRRATPRPAEVRFASVSRCLSSRRTKPKPKPKHETEKRNRKRNTRETTAVKA